jgi:hypothetical protein
LRAPDIYWEILRRAGDRLVRLGDVADVRRGITTGANEFFYLTSAEAAERGIEGAYLAHVIKSPQECERYGIADKNTRQLVFMCHKPKRQLKGTRALEYIAWGESKRLHDRASVSNRRLWYDLGERQAPALVWQKSVNDRHVQCVLLSPMYVDQRLYEVTSAHDPLVLAAVLNSSFVYLSKEAGGRVNLGEGALDTAVYEAQEILVPDIRAFGESTLRQLHDLMVTMVGRPALPVQEEILLDDRRQLDELVLGAIGLGAREAADVRLGLNRLVSDRVHKAKSLGERDSG